MIRSFMMSSFLSIPTKSNLSTSFKSGLQQTKHIVERKRTIRGHKVFWFCRAKRIIILKALSSPSYSVGEHAKYARIMPGVRVFVANNYIQEKILIAASDRISIVNLIDLDGLVQSCHHVIPHHVEGEVRAVQAPYVLDRLVAGRIIPWCRLLVTGFKFNFRFVLFTWCPSFSSEVGPIRSPDTWDCVSFLRFRTVPSILDLKRIR